MAELYRRSALRSYRTSPARWLVDATLDGKEEAAAPLGLYFARLWYYEELYPMVFALAGLAGLRSWSA